MKVLGHICMCGAFFKSHKPNPSPYPTYKVGRMYPEFFPRFNFVYGGVSENCKIFSKRLHCFIRAPRNYRKS